MQNVPGDFTGMFDRHEITIRGGPEGTLWQDQPITLTGSSGQGVHSLFVGMLRHQENRKF